MHESGMCTYRKLMTWLAAVIGGTSLDATMRAIGTEDRDGVIRLLHELTKKDLVMYQHDKDLLGRRHLSDIDAVLAAAGYEPAKEIALPPE